MVGKYLSTEEKSRVLALREENVTQKEIARRTGRSLTAIKDLLRRARDLPDGGVPLHKNIPGRPRKTSTTTDRLLKRKVTIKPAITSSELKKELSIPLQNVSERTIRHRLQKDLDLPSRRAALKPMLTQKMKNKRVAFCKKYKDWTIQQWRNVMFSDESNFKCIQGTPGRVRRPPGSNRCDPRYTTKTVKHSDYVMIWGAFSGTMGRGGLYFLPKNETMNGIKYIDVLEAHLLPFYRIHGCAFFQQDSAPCHTSKLVKKWLSDHSISVLEWPGNSPDLNPIENCWHQMKVALKNKDVASVPRLKAELVKLWINMDMDYFLKLADSMPKRIFDVLAVKGDMTKY